MYVGRPSTFGNPHRVGDCIMCDKEHTVQGAVDCFRYDLDMMFGHSHVFRAHIDRVYALEGHDLACWCRLDQPCHADVLLEIVNEINS